MRPFMPTTARRARDSKRERVYDAQRAQPEYNQLLSWPEVEAFIAEINASRWFRARWDTVIQPVFKRGGSAYGYPGGRITLPAFARSKLIILHEVAHSVCCEDPGYQARLASHGPEFCGVYLALLDRFMGPEVAGRVRAEFRSRRVTTSNALLPAPARPVVTVAEVRRAAIVSRVPLSDRERDDLAALLRRAAVSGAFGAAGSKPRAQALALARGLRVETVAAAKQ
jgi:putative metallohydrolase (TIGR04338 family)